MPKKKAATITLTKQMVFNIFVVLVLMILSLLLYATIMYTSERLDRQAETQFNSQQEAIYHNTMLTFCYDHSIHPCDWTALEEWNASNPGDTFTTLTPIQLRNKLNPPQTY